MFFLMFSMAASGMAVLPSLRMGVTSTDSQAMGVCEERCQNRAWDDEAGRRGREKRRTLAAAKMSLTDSAISGPMPSPSMKLTRWLPCKSVLLASQFMLAAFA